MSNIDQWNEWMKARGISQTALAEMLHCSRGTVNRILSRARKPSPLVARRMEELMEEGNALLVLEWPEYLARERYAGERLEVHLVHHQGNIEELHGSNEQNSEHVTPLKSLDNADKSCKSFRLATLEAHGTAAEALLDSLLPRLSQCFMPVKA